MTNEISTSLGLPQEGLNNSRLQGTSNPPYGGAYTDDQSAELHGFQDRAQICRPYYPEVPQTEILQQLMAIVTNLVQIMRSLISVISNPLRIQPTNSFNPKYPGLGSLPITTDTYIPAVTSEISATNQVPLEKNKNKENFLGKIIEYGKKAKDIFSSVKKGWKAVKEFGSDVWETGKSIWRGIKTLFSTSEKTT